MNRREVGRRRGHDEVLDAAGISYRQLSYWCDQGLLGPEQVGRGSGTQRSLDDTDVAILCALGRMSEIHRGRAWRDLLVAAIRNGDEAVELLPGLTADLRVLTRELEAEIDNVA